MKPGQEELRARAKAISLLVFDVDGVLTDGGLYYGTTGEQMKRFDVKDGHGIVMARLVGVRCAVLTARTSSIVAARGRELGLCDVAQGQRDKRAGLLEMLKRNSVEPSACAYMGDDVNDLPAMALVGLPSCPADASMEVRKQALFVAQARGGFGAARELVELCLRAQGLWDKALAVNGGPADSPPSVAS